MTQETTWRLLLEPGLCSTIRKKFYLKIRRTIIWYTMPYIFINRPLLNESDYTANIHPKNKCGGIVA